MSEIVILTGFHANTILSRDERLEISSQLSSFAYHSESNEEKTPKLQFNSIIIIIFFCISV